MLRGDIVKTTQDLTYAVFTEERFVCVSSDLSESDACHCETT